MCHLKLGLTLAQTGYKEGDKRLGVYLTNSLEEPHEDYETLFAAWLSEESNEASRIKKEMPIMVALGNPPYSVSSSNRGEWIEKLMEDYKKNLNERNIQPLSDDYIKFLRYAQYNIEKTGYGIVAMITNNSFIDGVIHRRMRESLLTSFDKIYIYDLHGNSKKKETSPDGSKDENVFDIMQGVSISLMVKTTRSEKPAEVYHYDSFGLREKKYEELRNKGVENTKWKKLKTNKPNFFFVLKDLALEEEYNKNPSINDIFGMATNGIKTHRDGLVIDYDKKTLTNRIEEFYSEMPIGEIKQKYSIKETNNWTIKNARKNGNFKKEFITKIAYRPFDDRFIYYDSNLIDRGREKYMRHMLETENVGLLAKRQCKQIFSYVFITNLISESCVFESAYANNAVFPLYLYPDTENTTLFESQAREPNLNPEIIAQIEKKLGLEFTTEDSFKELGALETPPVAKIEDTHFYPEDVLDYIYAVLHSPTYREKYKEFLKIDFPRVPFTDNKKVFWQCVKLGCELRNLHLLESDKVEKFITGFPVSGDNIVDKVTFEGEEKGKVWFNDTQYFDKVPRAAWEFFIGGYQPAQKWLKDRKGRKLTNDDIEHYQKIIVALTETDRIMKEVDGVTRGWV